MVDLPGPTSVRGIGASQLRTGVASSIPRKASNDVVVTKGGSQTKSLARDLATEPAPVDQAKVAEIRAAITAGTYSIDPHKIARALLGNG